MLTHDVIFPAGRIVRAIIVVFSLMPSITYAGWWTGRIQTLEDSISYRTDLAPGTTFETVASANDGWISQAIRKFPLTKDPVDFWAKFDLPATSAPQRVLIMSSAWERIDFYFVRDGQLISRQPLGILRPVSERSKQVTMKNIFTYSGFAETELLPGAHLTVFAHIATTQRYLPIRWLRFSIWDEEKTLASERHDRLVQGIYLGIILFLAVYNLGLFFATREVSHLYYVIMVSGGALYFAAGYGLTTEYLWPDHPMWEYCAPWIALSVALFAFAQFVRSYLDTRKSLPVADRLVKYAGRGSLVLVVNPLISLAVPGWWNYVDIWVAVYMPLMLGVIVWACARRHPLAANALAAGLALAIGAVIWVGLDFEWLPETDFTKDAAQIGTCLFGIILSIGLGFRLRDLQGSLTRKQLEEARAQSAHEREKLELIEQQRQNLERTVQERTAELRAANETSDALLGNILPAAVVEELKANGKSEPRRYDEVSILFSDFAGFTEAVATIPPKRLVQELDEIFREFDSIMAAHGLEKIKTIGDAYMAGAGLPIAAEDHAVRCVRAGLALTQFVTQRNHTSAIKWGLRVGVHSGTVVAGIIGKNKYAYDVWGDTVNIASRLQSASEISRVNISAFTYDQAREHFDCEYRGKLSVKGKGDIDMYFIVRERNGP